MLIVFWRNEEVSKNFGVTKFKEAFIFWKIFWEKFRIIEKIFKNV